MLQMCSSKISEHLSLMFRGNCPGRLQLDNQYSIDQQISNVLSKDCAVLIEYRQRMLLRDIQS